MKHEMHILRQKLKNEGLTHYEIMDYFFKNNLYSKKEIESFNNRERTLKKSYRESLQDLIEGPLKEDWLEFWKIPSIFRKYSEKKQDEYMELFLGYPYNQNGKELTFGELIDNWIPIEQEYNSEWDFKSKDGSTLLEITNVALIAGKLYGKIKKKYPKSENPIFKNEEIFESAIKPIEKKLYEKKGKQNCNHIIIIIIRAFELNELPSIMKVVDLEYADIEKYHQILVKKNKTSYMNFKNGKIIFVYDNMFLKKRTYEINGYMINMDFKKEMNHGGMFSVKYSEGDTPQEEWDILQDRMYRKIKFKNI